METERTGVYEIINFNFSTHGEVRFELFEEDSRYVAPHWHDAIEIICVLKGELTVATEQHQYHLHGDQCIVLPPYALHSTISVHGNTGLLLQIPVSAFSEYVGGVSNWQFACGSDPADPAKQAALGRLLELLKQMRMVKLADEPAGKLRGFSLLFEVMYELINCFAQTILSSTTEQSSDKNRERLAVAMTYTEAHYQQPISLEEVAGELHLQVNYFCQFFKKTTGMTYLQYLNEYRMSKVYHDMIATDLPLKELLERHGMTNYKLFRRMFVERFGMPPSEFRKKHPRQET